MDKIRTYKNSIFISFEKRGDNFTLKVPHYKKWLEIIKFLRNRGWNIGENKHYKEHYSCLSKYHKIGFKGGMALLMEIKSNGIDIEFGDIKNLWKDMPQSFWSNKLDERYSKLTYLEEIAVKLEIKKMIDFCSKYQLERIQTNENLTPEQRIIHDNKTNPHVHGKVECLNDIKLAITEASYNYKSNSDDKNKKKIICGETKYFYDYNNRLSYGVVWHNINNMWWVIAGGVLRNIVCWELFDYEAGLPKRKPVDENKINKLLKSFESKRDYRRCMAIQKYSQKTLKKAA